MYKKHIFYHSFTPELTKLFINCFCATKNAIKSGKIIINVAAHTFAHCIFASFDFAKIARPTVNVRFSGEFVTINGHKELFQ